MTWRDHAWEFVINAVSWLVAILALAAVVAWFTLDTLKQRRDRSKERV